METIVWDCECGLQGHVCRTYQGQKGNRPYVEVCMAKTQPFSLCSSLSSTPCLDPRVRSLLSGFVSGSPPPISRLYPVRSKVINNNQMVCNLGKSKDE